jgi:hypothetical protein
MPYDKSTRCVILTLALTLLSLCLPLSRAAAADPQWLYPWQRDLASYLKKATADDYATQAQPIKPDWFEANLDKIERYRFLVTGYTPLLPFTGQLANLPAESFTWNQIWRADEPVIQAILKSPHLQVNQGQLWIPAHPSAACILSWAYRTQEPWNPYAGNKAIANRAVAISIVALLGWVENDYYYRHPDSPYTGRRFGVHGGVTGFGLTFQAYTLNHLKDTLPPEVVKAWSEGLVFMCKRINSNTPTGPANMRLSVPVGMYYTWLATGNEEVHEMYKRWMGLVVYSNLLSPSGHYHDGEGRGPDGSYNGIGAHRLAELYSITKDPQLLDVLRQFYILKAFQTLPEPDGKWISPSHYNDRCQSSFATDQYRGRETQLVADVPWATLYLRRLRESQKPLTPALIASLGSRPATRLPAAFPYDHGQGRSGRMHDWGNILHLPDYEYHVDEARVLEALADTSIQLPVLTSDRFSNNLNNEFIHIRRPAYYAMFYGGATHTSDNGVTNYRNMLKDEGGLMNGLAGGGLSALWTPAGTFLIGRLTAYENYERKEMVLNEGKSKYLIPGWQDWANNHIIGQTLDNKIMGSARVSWPKVTYPDSGQSLTISSTVPKKSARQGDILEADIAYERHYTFDDDTITARLTITSNKDLQLKSFYEAIPVQITPDLKTVFLDAQGKELEDKELISNVAAVELQREHGSLKIVFASPVKISRQSVQIVSRQDDRVTCRTLLVELPVSLQADKPAVLTYRLVPTLKGPPPAATQMVQGKLPDSMPDLNMIVQEKLHELTQDYILAHYRADSVETDAQGNVTRWRDLSANGLHLTPLKPNTAPQISPTRDAVIFNGKQCLSVPFPESIQPRGFAGVALIDCDVKVRTTRPAGNGTVVLVQNTTPQTTLSVIPFAPNGPESGPYGIRNTRGFRDDPGKPMFISVGATYRVNDNGPQFVGSLYQGKIHEIILYNRSLNQWQCDQLLQRMVRLSKVNTASR